MPETVADTPGAQVFGNLWANGDFNEARKRLLHTTSWVQHGRTAFGDELIARQWMRWQTLAGPSRLVETLDLQSKDQRVLLFTLRPEGTDAEVRLALWTWTNGVHFRQVHCLVDTQALGRARGLADEDLIAALPTPDPLIISEYDQATHPHHVDVRPSQLARLDGGQGAALDGWWQLWTESQLANLDEYWTADADIRLPGTTEATDRSGLRRFFTQEVALWQRRACQPEAVIAQGSSVGVLWHIDCDLATGNDGAPLRRVRIPVISILGIDGGRITRETMVCDLLAVEKNRPQ